MERQYVSLRAAPQQPDSDPQHQGLPAIPELKKRRVSVSIACNACRQKKIRCDSQRPICTNCLRATKHCIYRDESELSHESRKLVKELIHMLNSLPATKAIQTLRALRTETSASIILSTIRDVVGASGRPLAYSTAAATSGNTSELLEFEIQNPTAYPALAGQDGLELGDTLRLGRSVSLAEGWDSSSYPGNRISSSSNSSPAYNLSPTSKLDTSGRRVGAHSELGPPELCDFRLRRLEIKRWTNVDIENEVAARCISLYLETDHPLLGHFDPELFVSHLVCDESEYCSSLLVNALLYWACQMYSFIDHNTDKLAIKFCTEAERLWAIERENERDSLTTLAAAEFLCLGYLGQGRDHAIVAYASEASNMGKRMGLFGTQEHDHSEEPSEPSQEAVEATRARMHTAWGVYNWITLMSLFYRQPGLGALDQPPSIAIPKYDIRQGHEFDQSSDDAAEQSISSGYMGYTFPYICRFWSILSEVSGVYSGDGQQPWGFNGSLLFAEFKFRELLAWSNTMPSSLSEDNRNPHHVQILHLWFHAAILDLFRPHMQSSSGGVCHLRTFTGTAITVDAVCASSVAQLKYLIANYRLNYQSSTYTILWHTALIYVINAVLNCNADENWYSDILLCVHAYERLGRSWRVARGIAKGLMSLIVQKSDISSRTARRILQHVESNPDHFPGEIRATFMADLNLALSDPSSATVEYLAKQFEDNMLLRDYTTVLDTSERSSKNIK